MALSFYWKKYHGKAHKADWQDRGRARSPGPRGSGETLWIVWPVHHMGGEPGGPDVPDPASRESHSTTQAWNGEPGSPDVSGITGETRMKRLVGYIRQSLHDAASSSPERQVEIIEAWAKAHGYIVAQIYRDIGGKRSESDNVKTRKDFQKLLKDADARKFDIIIVASQDRFGTSDFYEFVGYLDKFNKLGIELWDAGKNLLLNPHGTEAAGILQSTIGTIIDTGEQVTISRNTITGQTTKARKGNYLGGPIAYGVAI